MMSYSFILVMILSLFFIYSSSIKFPDGLVVDMTKSPYYLDNTGKSDCSQQVQKAINDMQGSPYRTKTWNFTTMYFPSGIYRFSNGVYGSDNEFLAAEIHFLGEYVDNTTFTLDSNAKGYDDPQNPKAFIQFYTGTKSNNVAFQNQFEGITIEIGENNKGCIGLSFFSNNCGLVKDVKIISKDKQGTIGLTFEGAVVGMGFITRVYVEGFDVGMQLGAFLAAVSIEHIELRDQKVVGLINNEKPASIRGYNSYNDVPAFKSTSSLSLTTLIDCSFVSEHGSQDTALIIEDGFLLARNVDIRGYKNNIENKGKIINMSISKGEYVNEVIQSFSDTHTPHKTMQLPIKEIPWVDWEYDFTKWKIIEPTGDGKSDSENVQKAIDSGSTVIAFKPQNTYNFDTPVVIRKNVKQVLGMWSRFYGIDNTTQAIFEVEDTSQEVLSLGQFFAQKGLMVRNKRNKGSLIIRDILGDLVAYKNEGVCDLFVVNVCTVHGDIGWEFTSNQDVWARQIDPEQYNTRIQVDSGRLWILGFKVGEHNQNHFTFNGGHTELLGGMVNVCGCKGNVKSETPMILNNKGSMSVTLLEIPHVCSTTPASYETVIREIEDNNKLNYLLRNETSKRNPQIGSVLPLFVSYKFNMTDRPLARLIVSPSIGKAPLAVFVDSSFSFQPFGDLDHFEIDFGDSSSIEQNEMITEHVYENRGQYSLTLTVFSNGKYSKADRLIIVR